MAAVPPPRENVVAPIEPGNPAPQIANAPAVLPERSAPAISGNKAPRRSANRNAVGPITHPLLHGVANIPFFGIQGATSTLVPDATAMYNALEVMDMHMATIRRFYENSPTWNPLLSQAYIGVLWYVQILRCSQNAGEIRQDSFAFLSWFESMFPYQNLAVPGPLVPFFQALGVCAGPFDQYGDVTPVLPVPTGSRSNYWFATHGLARLLPPVHIFVDQLCFLGNLNTNIVAAASTNPIRIYTNVLGNNVPAAANAADPFNTMGYFPGIANRWHISATHIQTWHASRFALNLPTRMITDAVPAGQNLVRGPNSPLAIGELLRFATAGRMHPQWFVTTVSIMQRYCQFFSGSTSLAGISTSGFGASIPRWIVPCHSQRVENRAPTYVVATSYTSTPAVAVTFNYLTWPMPTNQGLSSETGDPTLIPNQDGSDPNRLARQFSAATQISVSHRLHTPGAEYTSFPSDDSVFRGPLWNLTTVAQSPPVDNTLVSGQNILGMFVADTRLN